MDAWPAIIMVVNILLLVAGWVLFQQAKSDLTARAAQIPIISEVKALQKSVVALLEQLKLEAIQTSAQLEARCLEARNLVAALDHLSYSVAGAPAAEKRSDAMESLPAATGAAADASPAAVGVGRREQVYSLADSGLEAKEIAQRTGMSEGEVELFLGLRESGRPGAA